MKNSTPVLFGQALTHAIAITKALGPALGNEVILVRDFRGRIRPILPTKPTNEAALARLQQYASDISAALGAYGFGAGRALMFADEFAETAALLNEKRVLDEGDCPTIYLLDRQIIGQDWMRNQLARTTTNPRITFYGIKGGVGRSTALVNWAWHLAEQGKKVLIFDLDLESPGVSSSLLPVDHLPDFGIVDWFVEDGVGQADIVAREMLGTSPLAQRSGGTIKVVPAYGTKTGDYLPKLARCYAELNGVDGNQAMSWAERLQRLVETLEQAEQPDVVIFDSRAGLHDIAAVAVTRMDAETFLFAVNSAQTWNGYALLFRHWNQHPQVRQFRQRLQLVAGMVPETGRDAYLQSCKENAWDLFANLYDQADAEDADAFNFDLDDETAPHFPLSIFWHRALQEFDPVVGGIDAKTASEAYGLFMAQADQILASARRDGRP
jgi:hypothetical protein